MAYMESMGIKGYERHMNALHELRPYREFRDLFGHSLVIGSNRWQKQAVHFYLLDSVGFSVLPTFEAESMLKPKGSTQTLH